MKAVILAEGLGTRITKQSPLKPKPMIEIGCKPIIWHIMKIYSQLKVVYKKTSFVRAQLYFCGWRVGECISPHSTLFHSFEMFGGTERIGSAR